MLWGALFQVLGQDVASENRIFYFLFSFIYFTIFTCHKLPQKKKEKKKLRNWAFSVWGFYTSHDGEGRMSQNHCGHPLRRPELWAGTMDACFDT